MNNSVGIVGAGWVGEALARTLISLGFSVQTTAQSKERIDALQVNQIPVEKLSLPCDFSAETVLPQVFSQKTLIICIPPQLKKGRTDYPLKIQQLVKAAELGKVEHLILLSTTAIYNGLSGEVDESSELNFKAEKVAILAEAENNAQVFKGRSSVLRLAGLIGPNRHPGNFFKRGRSLKEPDICVNLIHQTDVIGLIVALVKNETCSGIFNGVSETRLSKGEFYQIAAQSLNLPTHSATPAPILQEALGAVKQDEPKLLGKIVKGDKTKQTLGYQFYFDDLVKWLHIDTLQEIR